MLRKCIILLMLGLLLAAPASARRYKGDDTMLVSPYVLFLDYMGPGLTIHTEVDMSDVDRGSIVMTGAVGDAIEPMFLKSDARGNLVARFEADDIRTIVVSPRTTLTLHGMYRDGEPFTLTATIRVR
jgi:hypothetical protein